MTAEDIDILIVLSSGFFEKHQAKLRFQLFELPNIPGFDKIHTYFTHREPQHSRPRQIAYIQRCSKLSKGKCNSNRDIDMCK